jgi:glycosyltransferase involved in cell wall biosynthesis
MRIGIDARFLTHPQPGGFKTYTQNLTMALAEVDAENEYVLYIDRPPDQDTRLPDRPNFATRIVPGSLPLLGMPWREQVGLSRQAARDKLDLLHSPSLTAPLRLACPSVVTIHDMIWFFAEKFSRHTPSFGKRKLMEWYYRFVPQFAVRNASAILTVSHAAKESIVQHLGLSPDQVFVTHEAASPIYRRVDDLEKIEAVRRKYHLASDFVLAIGSADPRKNVAALVRACTLLPTLLQERYQLAIVWTHHLLAPGMAEQIKASGINSQVRFLEGVSDEELVLLYNAASLFVFPSLYEGFGLPPLEAMACGTPVVAANNSSIPEIVGDAALLFDAKDTEAMACVIAQVLADGALQAGLIEKGLKRAASFSWAKCARETVAVYRWVPSK